MPTRWSMSLGRVRPLLCKVLQYYGITRRPCDDSSESELVHCDPASDQLASFCGEAGKACFEAVSTKRYTAFAPAPAAPRAIARPTRNARTPSIPLAAIAVPRLVTAPTETRSVTAPIVSSRTRNKSAPCFVLACYRDRARSARAAARAPTAPPGNATWASASPAQAVRRLQHG